MSDLSQSCDDLIRACDRAMLVLGLELIIVAGFVLLSIYCMAVGRKR